MNALGAHPLHDRSRTWPETNCSVDLWVELLEALGQDPALALGAVLESGLDGRAWTFHKYDLEDLWSLHGIRVRELAPFRSLADTVAAELADGRYVTVEVDAIHLPDTEGLTYRTAHGKTSLAVLAFDPDEPRVDYAHGAGRWSVTGDDAAALLRLGGPPAGELPPYLEQVDVTALHAPSHDDVMRAACTHWARRAPGNPVAALTARIETDLDWLVPATAADPQAAYEYAFAVVRQCGAGAQLTADHLRAIGVAGAEECDRVAEGAKTLQFQVLRRAMGRRGDLAATVAAMAADWDRAAEAIEAGLG